MKSIKKIKAHAHSTFARESWQHKKKIKQGNKKKNVRLHVLNKNFVALWKSNVSKRKIEITHIIVVICSYFTLV